MRVWTVSEVKAGTLTQCVGVGRHIDPEPHSVVVSKKLRRWRTGLLSPYRDLQQPEPGIIISCGSMAPRHVFAIAKACRKRPFTVHLQTPQPEFVGQYDMAFISRHDWTEAKAKTANFHQMLGVPHQVTRERLENARPAARAAWVKVGAKVVTVLIGGSNGAYLFDDATIEKLIATVRGLAAQGWTALVSTSRRSEPTILSRLLALRSERIVVWDRTGTNPYIDFLAAADAFLITKDTITMNCEAVTSGRPVYSFDLAKTPCDKLDKFEWFHADMSATLGLTRPFEGEIGHYDYSPPDEARRIADLIRDAIPTRRAGR
ncbi:mitochondrial fission ELM1 family protein [Mesorhizobium sp. AaZ16]|uniref:mitochondrial fission ELM1 family protein n=1 Tax=Mesorhizobium sp. AaZ16 TaxID=3402289 RepID=UPI00374F4A2D